MSDPARARFFTVQLVRLASVGLALVGLLVVRAKIDLAPAAGWIMLAAGLIGAFVVPQVLARKWRSGQK